MHFGSKKRVTIYQLIRTPLRRSLLAGVGLALVAACQAALALEERLVILTSFPEDLTGVFQHAFERKYPGTQVEVLTKPTAAGVRYLQETAGNTTTDLFWVSAPDAFAMLKAAGRLEALQPQASGIPASLGGNPLQDPDGTFFGFAVSGYGIMYNSRYLEAQRLPPPQEWEDLKAPAYFGHVALAAPSRSGTTHLMVEAILQGEGWEQGWGTLKQLAGNAKAITDSSFAVPEGVNRGEFGAGIVIDFFGFAAQAAGFPVAFVYPRITALVPASVGLVKQAPHPQAGRAFIDFLLSDEGQELLLEPKISRLPVKPAIYAKAPPGLPNPFTDPTLGAAVRFDAQLSESRYHLVNALFDRLITSRMAELRAATAAVHAAEAALGRRPDPQAQGLLDQARARITAVPVTAVQASDPALLALFENQPERTPDSGPQRRAALEEAWERFAQEHYTEAQALAEEARLRVK